MNPVYRGLERRILTLQQQLAIWSRGSTSAWKHLASRNDTTQQYVASAIYHFSQYAVSW